MNRVLHLIRLDLRQVSRDSMLALALFAPLLLIAAVRYGVPWVADLLIVELSFDLMAYDDLLLSFVLILIPLMLGMLTGFMMLDERDENLIQYYAVTPLTKMGYFNYRLAMPVALSIGYNTLLLLSSPFELPSLLASIPTLLMLAMEAPMIALLLTAFANNKVEGLALSKGLGLIVFVPAVAYFVPYPWQLIAGLVPTYWASQTLLLDMKNAPGWTLATCTGIGVTVHYFVLRVLAMRFRRRTD